MSQHLQHVPVRITLTTNKASNIVQLKQKELHMKLKPRREEEKKRRRRRRGRRKKASRE